MVSPARGGGCQIFFLRRFTNRLRFSVLLTACLPLVVRPGAGLSLPARQRSYISLTAARLHGTIIQGLAAARIMCLLAIIGPGRNLALRFLQPISMTIYRS